MQRKHIWDRTLTDERFFIDFLVVIAPNLEKIFVSSVSVELFLKSLINLDQNWTVIHDLMIVAC